MNKIQEFEKMERGLFVHYGLYSIIGKGEWYMHNFNIEPKEYEKYMAEFRVKKTWAKELINIARSIDAKYIVLTTRHHDGFSLYDTKGLTNYDVMHTPTNRDLVREFVEECNKNNIKPFFYHTLIDWHDKRFKDDTEKYFKYLLDSLKLLCQNYGEIGGFWFDGTWSDANFNWHLDEIFNLIKELQPNAIIANNGGQEYPGQIIHPDIDCIVYERVTPTLVKNSDDKYRAKEVCQTLNSHWGYAKNDNNYKSLEELLSIYKECRLHKTNFLINVGPCKSGKIPKKQKAIMETFGRKIKN